MGKFKKLQYKVESGLVRIAMNWPDNLNAIDEIMAEEILAALREADKDEQVRVIVLESLGRAFSAGGDIRYMYGQVRSGEEVSISDLASLVGQIALQMKKSAKVIVTVVRGPAAGAGANLALGGDYVICTEKAVFLQAFATIGLVPDTGGVYLLSRSLTPQQIMEYCMFDKQLSAADAKSLGLVNRVVPDEECEKTVREVTDRILQGPQKAFGNIKRQLFSACFSDYGEYLNKTEFTTVNESAASPDFHEGVCAFIEKRKAHFA